MAPTLAPAQKALHCARAILAVMRDADTVDAVDARLREQLGAGWSLVSAASYLTGKAARRAIERQVSQLGPAVLEDVAQAVSFSTWLCVSPESDAPWSGATQVRELRRRMEPGRSAAGGSSVR